METNDSHPSAVNRKAPRVPFYVTIETNLPVALQPGKSYKIANDPLTELTGSDGRLSGILWTDKSLDDVWDTVWKIVQASDPVRVSLAGKSAGRTWGKESLMKTARFVNEETGRGWQEE